MKLGKYFAMAFCVIFAAAVTAYPQFPTNGVITGRVTRLSGRGVPRANVAVTNLLTLETREKMTNELGYFRFEGMSILDFYMVSVRARRYFFFAPTQLVQFAEPEHFSLFVAMN